MKADERQCRNTTFVSERKGREKTQSAPWKRSERQEKEAAVAFNTSCHIQTSGQADDPKGSEKSAESSGKAVEGQGKAVSHR